MTATLTPERRAQCLAAGMTDCLSKPIVPRDLRRLVAELASTGAQSELHGPTSESPSQIVADAADLETALSRLNGKRLLLTRLAALWPAEADAALHRMRDALTASDGPALQQTAHRLKGQAATFAANEVMRLAGELETCGQQGDLLQAAAVLPRLNDAVGQLSTQLRELAP
jgi:HPt (histidine-containing phosphotransfer) domain-containing protein